MSGGKKLTGVSVGRKSDDPRTLFMVGYEIRSGEFQPGYGPSRDLQACRDCRPDPERAAVACIVAVTRYQKRGPDCTEKLFVWDVGTSSWVLAESDLGTRRVPAEKAKAPDTVSLDDIMMQPLISLEYVYEDQQPRLDTIAMPSSAVAKKYVERIKEYVRVRYPDLVESLQVYQVGAKAMTEREIFALVDEIADDNLASPGDSLMKGAHVEEE